MSAPVQPETVLDAVFAILKRDAQDPKANITKLFDPTMLGGKRCEWYLRREGKHLLSITKLPESDNKPQKFGQGNDTSFYTWRDLFNLRFMLSYNGETVTRLVGKDNIQYQIVLWGNAGLKLQMKEVNGADCTSMRPGLETSGGKGGENGNGSVAGSFGNASIVPPMTASIYTNDGVFSPISRNEAQLSRERSAPRHRKDSLNTSFTCLTTNPSREGPDPALHRQNTLSGSHTSGSSVLMQPVPRRMSSGVGKSMVGCENETTIVYEEPEEMVEETDPGHLVSFGGLIPPRRLGYPQKASRPGAPSGSSMRNFYHVQSSRQSDRKSSNPDHLLEAGSRSTGHVSAGANNMADGGTGRQNPTGDQGPHGRPRDRDPSSSSASSGDYREDLGSWRDHSLSGSSNSKRGSRDDIEGPRTRRRTSSLSQSVQIFDQGGNSLQGTFRETASATASTVNEYQVFKEAKDDEQLVEEGPGAASLATNCNQGYSTSPDTFLSAAQGPARSSRVPTGYSHSHHESNY